MMNKCRNCASFPISASKTEGFTLVELMVAVALGAFLIGGTALMFLAGRTASADAEQLARMQENIRFASDLMIRDIRNAAFRDEVGLTVADHSAIGVDYAVVGNEGDAQSLDIRYGGRGTCVEEFDTQRQVINRYSLVNGELRCIGVNSDRPAQTLVSGLNDLQFQLICPAANSACTCDLDTVDPCIGVRIRMSFDGPRGEDGAPEPRAMELTASFRNVILGRMAIPPVVPPAP